MGVTTVDQTGGVARPEAPQNLSGWHRRLQEYRLMLRLLLRSPLAATGLIIVLVYVGIVLYAQFLPGNDQMTTNFANTGPDPPFWWPGATTAVGGLLGTTFPGIDLLDAIIKAIRIDLMYSTFVVLIGAAIGAFVGLYAGYRGGLFDEALMRITDITYSIPFLVFVIAVAFAFGKRDFLTVNTVLLILWWPPYARLVRAQTLSVKEIKFVEAARAAGASDGRIMLRHILPNTFAPVSVQISLDLGTVTQIFAALNFIGFNSGNLFLPELGNLINIGWEHGFRSYPWTILMPGLALLIFTVAVNLLGDGLRDVLDPRLRR
jgi:peptide/nickel transport system permease protein